MAGFPGLGLLRVLRPAPAASADDGPSRPPIRRPAGEGPPGRFPRSPHDRSLREASSYAPATSPRLRRRHSSWPPDRRHQPAQEFPDPNGSGAHGCPAHIRQVRAGGSRLRSFQPLVSHVRLLISLAGPRPSDGAGPSRRCRGCCPPSPASPGSGCPQLHPPAATGGPRRSLTPARSHSASWRSMSATQSSSGPSALKSRSTRSGRRARRGIGCGGAPRLAAPLGATDPVLAHQPLNPAAADRLSRSGERLATCGAIRRRSSSHVQSPADVLDPEAAAMLIDVAGTVGELDRSRQVAELACMSRAW